MEKEDSSLIVTEHPYDSLWQQLKEAICGSEADYTKIGLRKAIFLLAVPMILELVMESTFAIVDIYFVGKLGASAVATVGLTETYLFLLYSIAMGLATAVTAIIARRILSYSYFVYGWGMVSVQAFNGAGDTMTPTKINLVFFWLIQIPLSYFLAISLDWQYSGVFWGVFVSETAAGLFTLWLFTKGKWKTKMV